MVALIDTNILIDFLSSRESFSENAKKIIEHCKNKRFSGLIVSQSVVDAFYILRKLCPLESLKEYFINLSYIFNFVGTSEKTLINALNNTDFLILRIALFTKQQCSIMQIVLLQEILKIIILQKSKFILQKNF